MGSLRRDGQAGFMTMVHSRWIVFILVYYLKICLAQRRIIKGSEVNRDKRYMVYFLSAEDAETTYRDWLCVGALISTSHVLTAAACLTDVTRLYVIAGYKKYVNGIDVEKDSCTSKRKKKVVRVCTPRSYKLNYENVSDWMRIDIGLATVDEPYDFNDKSYRIDCTYTPGSIDINYDPFLQKMGTSAIVMGWGTPKRYRQPEDIQDQNSEYLRYARTRITPVDRCVKYFTNHTGAGDVMREFMICSSSEGFLDIDGKEVKGTIAHDDGCRKTTEKPHKSTPAKHNVSNEEDDFDWRRSGKLGSRRHQAESDESYEDYSDESSKSRPGFCQNDHGAPLVTWSGSKEYVVGVASACLVSTDTLLCLPPYLYTSTYCTGLFLQCVLSGSADSEVRRRCTEIAKEKGIAIEEHPVTWTEQTQSSDTKKQESEQQPPQQESADMRAEDNITDDKPIETTTITTKETAETPAEENKSEDVAKENNNLVEKSKEPERNDTEEDYNPLEMILNLAKEVDIKKPSPEPKALRTGSETGDFDPLAIIEEEFGDETDENIDKIEKSFKKATETAEHITKEWMVYGKPAYGPVYADMCASRKIFKEKLKWCQDNQEQIKMNILATHHQAKQFGKFWKHTSRMNHGPSLPADVEGLCEPEKVANLFKEHFKVISPLDDVPSVPYVEDLKDEQPVRFSSKQVSNMIKSLTKGKSPGHDGLSIEHLRHAGAHLTRVLKMFLNLCMTHCYLPGDLMRTIVVPIVKDRTGNASDKSNYRPISLATITAKILDGLLDGVLSAHVQSQDAQFGFKPGLSTETAILCFKHTVQYYTDGNTPVYACFLDLSKAFDLVAYDVLWEKLDKDTNTPRGVVNLFRFWYGNQTNQVRWAGSHSDVYRLKCGVRQGGLSSPRLFNLYMDKLIARLSSTGIGCSIGGVTVNNISYADDMVLLCPAISALVKLLRICEEYAVAHGLRYNASKSELMVFKARKKSINNVPTVHLCGAPLKRVSRFKYLGHWVTDDLKDDVDVERERRALAVRSNMLSRRFARCDRDVKTTLFRAFCQTFYTCSLWSNCSKKTLNALRVQYNNGFRMLMGLPRFCSASGMFAEAGTDSFGAIMRKRATSIVHRVRDSPNSILKLIWASPACHFMSHWDSLHMESRHNIYNIF